MPLMELKNDSVLRDLLHLELPSCLVAQRSFSLRVKRPPVCLLTTHIMETSLLPFVADRQTEKL